MTDVCNEEFYDAPKYYKGSLIHLSVCLHSAFRIKNILHDLMHSTLNFIEDLSSKSFRINIRICKFITYSL